MARQQPATRSDDPRRHEEIAANARPAARASTLKSVRKRKLILEAAAGIMCRHGYAETTVERIAHAAGTQAGSLYYHFDSRDHIVEEVIKESMARLAADVETCLAQIPAQASCRERLMAVMRAQVASSCGTDEFMAAFRRVANEIPQPLREKVIAAPRNFGNLWRGLLEEARDAAEIRADLDLTVVRLLVIGSVIWTSSWYDSKGPKTPDEIAQILGQMFFEGMARN